MNVCFRSGKHMEMTSGRDAEEDEKERSEKRESPLQEQNDRMMPIVAHRL